MTCNCDDLSRALNQINGKIDALIRENNQLKAQQGSIKQEAFNFTRDWILGQGAESIAKNVGATSTFSRAVSNVTANALSDSLSPIGAALEAVRRNAAEAKGQVTSFNTQLKKTTEIANQAKKSSSYGITLVQENANRFKGLENRIKSIKLGADDQIRQLARSNQYLSKSVQGLQSGFASLNGLMNKLAPLFAIVGLLVSIASLAVSIGSIKVLGNRIDILENGLNQQANALSKIYSIITPIKFKVDKLANISPNLQFEFDKLVKNVNSMNKDLSLAINNLQLADKAFMTKSAVQSLVNTAIATATSVIVGSAVGAIISRFPRIMNIPVSGTNTVTNNTRIIERQTINNTIIQPTRTIERNTFREIRTNTVSNTNSGANIDYGRIQSIVSNESNSTRNTVRNEHRVTRGLLGGIRQGVTATRTRLNNVAPPILKTDISQAVQQATKPIFDSVADIRKKTASIYQNQFVQSALNTLNTAILVHNAMRLSFDAGQFIADSLGMVINLTGIKFRDENQNEISLSQAIGNSLNDAIDSVIPATWQNRANDLWIRSSSIFSSSANVLWAVRNIGDELQNVTEITNDRLGLWMNTARDEGLVSSDAYPHQPPISTGSVYGRYNTFLAKVNSKTESWENTVNSVEDVAGSVGYIASVPITVSDELQQIGQNRENIVNAVVPVQEEKEAEYEEQLLDNEAPETLISPVPYLDDEG